MRPEEHDRMMDRRAEEGEKEKCTLGDLMDKIQEELLEEWNLGHATGFVEGWEYGYKAGVEAGAREERRAISDQLPQNVRDNL